MRINKTIQRWFPAPDDPDKSEHLIRHLTPGEVLDSINESTKQETKYITDKESGDLEPEMTSSTDAGLVQRSQFLLALSGWKNMFDENGKPMEFNKENKIRAMREIEGYMAFVAACRNTLAADVEKEKKAQIKNLSSSQSKA